MAQLKVPDTAKLYTTRYKELKGVDYSCDITEVNKARTPSGTNMISDDGGYPVKRRGWRNICNMGCGEVLKMIFHEDSEAPLYDPLKLYVIGRNGIYAMVTSSGNRSSVQLLSATVTSCEFFMFDGEVYAIVNGEMYHVHGTTADNVEDEAYIPEVTISTSPDGTGSYSLESVNILTPKRKQGFLGNSTDKQYYFYPSQVRSEDAYKYIVEDTIVVEELTINGWETLTKGTDYSTNGSVTVQGLNADGVLSSIGVCDPHITFVSTHPPLVTGQDNIRITYEAWNDAPSKVVISAGVYAPMGLYKEERKDLLSTNSCKTYGYASMDRLFIVGGKNKNRVYYSGVNQPTYFPDDNYIIVGHDSNGIVGLHRVGEFLAAIKEDSIIEGTVFLINGSYLDDKMYFKVAMTSAGTGGIAPNTFQTLIDEPLFLSRNGIYAVSNYYTTSEKIIRNRSFFVDKRLTKEEHLEKACAIVWKRYYILCVNDHCYVLDGRNKAGAYGNNVDFIYESYYWENVPARIFAVYENELYFGTIDGKLCKFNTDVPDRTAYCDDGTETIVDGKLRMEGGDAIYCEWTTPLDDDGSPQYFKTLNKKGSMITMLPYTRTSAFLTLIKDGGTEYPLNYIEYIDENGDSAMTSFVADIHDWELIDFSRFTFNSNDTAQDGFTKKKVKKYKRLQIKISNDVPYEPFGLLGIVKTYSVGNFSK